MATRTVGEHRHEPPLLELTAGAVAAADGLLAAATDAVRALVAAPDGRIGRGALEREQYAAHGLAWWAVHVEALRQMDAWARRLEAAGRFGELERLTLGAAFGEYLARLVGGVPMGQGEIVRPRDLGLDDGALDALMTPPVRHLMATGNTAAARRRIAELIEPDRFGDWGLEDEALELFRDQCRRFCDERVVPLAHGWHGRDELIPLEVVRGLGELGAFGLTVPEAYGGLGLGKVAMCVVTEELSRGYIGVGSLGTRSEIAAELIRAAGTGEQRERYLPGLASGAIIPTAVFTEPDTGSDLASLRTRAVRDGEVYRLHGGKTWITHAARADLMTVLCRTDPDERGYRGPSILLAEKPRGTDADPFPVPGLDGSEIPVLGYPA